jgi:hypothetical protein
MSNTKTTSSLWSRLAVGYYRDPKVISVGPWGELAWIRLLSLARENVESSLVDGSVVEIQGLRELRDITDLYTQCTNLTASDLLDELVEAELITREDGLLIVSDYERWQTTRKELEAIRRKRAS